MTITRYVVLCLLFETLRSNEQHQHGEVYRDVYSLYWASEGCVSVPVVDRYLLMSKRNGGQCCSAVTLLFLSHTPQVAMPSARPA